MLKLQGGNKLYNTLVCLAKPNNPVVSNQLQPLTVHIIRTPKHPMLSRKWWRRFVQYNGKPYSALLASVKRNPPVKPSNGKLPFNGVLHYYIMCGNLTFKQGNTVLKYTK